MKIPTDVKAILIDDILIIKGKLGVKKAKLKLDKLGPVGPDSSEIYAHTNDLSTKKIIKKMIVGVTIGFKQKLKLVGVGYKALKKDNELSLLLGFKNPRVISLAPPLPSRLASNTYSESLPQIQVEVRGNGTIIEAKSTSHKYLSQFISNIVQFKPATRDIYKHKGVVPYKT
jgi:ribosomal protein L6P/L9E